MRAAARFRDALNGRFTTRRDAEARPDNTVAEHHVRTGGWKVLSGTDNHVVLLWHVRRTDGLAVAAQRFLVELPDGDGPPSIRPLP